jgi:hypothetical protein
LLTLQTTDAAISMKDSGGTTRAYIGVAGAFGSAPTGALRLRSDQGGLVYGFAGAEQLRIDTSGNVGIGTSAPGNKLDIVSAGSSQIRVKDGINATAYYDFGRDNTDGFFGFSGAQTTFSGYKWSVNAGSEVMRITNGGNVGIGTSSPSYKLDVFGSSGSSITSRGWSANTTQSSQMHFQALNNGGSGDSNVAGYTFHCSGAYATHMHLRADGYIGVGGWSASAWRWYVNMTNGDMTAAGNVTAYSDPRLKEDIKKIDDPLGKILSLNGVRFKWKQSSVIGHLGEHDYGVLANEVEAVLPELVTGSAYVAPEGDTYKTVSYDKLIPVLIEAIKEQQIQINKLREDITSTK